MNMGLCSDSVRLDGVFGTFGSFSYRTSVTWRDKFDKTEDKTKESLSENRLKHSSISNTQFWSNVESHLKSLQPSPTSIMNRQPNDRELNSNTNPSSVDTKKVEEPNLKIDSLISSFYATAQASASSQQSFAQDSTSTLQDSSSSIDHQDRVNQRMQMTEHYLLKALNLDRR